eukprot:SM000311S11934  [mRNA]  locus=s311:78043:80007:+ [translate_table: standard]
MLWTSYERFYLGWTEKQWTVSYKYVLALVTLSRGAQRSRVLSKIVPLGHVTRIASTPLTQTQKDWQVASSKAVAKPEVCNTTSTSVRSSGSTCQITYSRLVLLRSAACAELLLTVFVQQELEAGAAATLQVAAAGCAGLLAFVGGGGEGLEGAVGVGEGGAGDGGGGVGGGGD